MTNDNDKLRRLRDWIFYEADVEPNPGGGYSFTEGRANPAHVLIEIDRLLAEPETQAPSEAASPVTDAEVEAAIESVRVAAHRYGVDAWAPTLIDESQALKSQEDKAVCDLRALIARRVQQAGAAAEELARAAAEYRTMVRPQHGECECAATAEKLDDALAAFRAAQGGGK